MKNILLPFLFFIIILLPKFSHATHAAGMDMSYECITAGTPGTPITTLVGNGSISVDINTGIDANECSWTITNSIGTIVAQGGQGNVYNNNSSYYNVYCLSQGSYTFNWIDSWGDGWNGGNYTILNPSGTNIISGNPNAGASGSVAFSVSSVCTNIYQTTYSGGTPDTYKITLRFYRDCGLGNLGAPNTFDLDYSSLSCGFSNSQTLSLVSTGNVNSIQNLLLSPNDSARPY